MKDSRVYVWAHAWLSPLQKGIQSAHAVAELVATDNKLVREWVENHKTLIILDGGPSKNLSDIEYDIASTGYAFASFREDEYSMEGMLTAVAVLITSDQMEFDRPGTPADWPVSTAQWWITKSRLAS